MSSRVHFEHDTGVTDEELFREYNGNASSSAISANNIGHDLGSFSAMASGAAPGGNPQGSYFSVPQLKRHVNDERTIEHREDGFEIGRDGRPSYFGPEWMNEQALRHRLLTEHPEMSFITLVAGNSGKPAEKLFDGRSLDEHAMRMLHRASVADELAKNALTDIERTQKLLKDFETRGSHWLKDLTTANRSRAEADFYYEEWRRYLENVYNVLTQRSYPKMDAQNRKTWGPQMDVRFSFVARCLYPVEGLDSTQFSQRVLGALATMVADARNLTPNPNQRATDDYKLQASQHNPRLINLAAYCAFAVHAAGTSSACKYIVRRMYSQKVFPETGEYAKDPTKGDLFCADLEKLVNLFATDTTHCVTMLNMSALLFIHLRCMDKRWFGPRVEPHVRDTKAATDDPCNDRPRLQKPQVPRAQRRGGISAFLTDEEDEEESFFYVEGQQNTTLYAEQKKRRKTNGPEQFQDLLAIILGPVFRYGMATLVYDMARLRELLCESAKQIYASVLCEEAEEKLRALLAASPAYNVDSATVTLSYFFGGYDLQNTGTAPHHPFVSNEFGDVTRSAVYYFVDTALHFYKRALSALEPLSNPDDERTREWFTPVDEDVRAQSQAMYERRVSAFFDFVTCSDSAERVHIENRKLAVYQASGALDTLLNIVRMYSNAREMHTRLAANRVPFFVNNHMPNAAPPLPLYVNAAEETSIVEKNAPTPSAVRRLVELLNNNIAQVGADLDRVRTELRLTAENVKDAIRELNQGLLRTEQGVMQQVNRRYRLEIDANTGYDLVTKLKQVLAETYIPSPDWATRPENTGQVLLHPVYVAASTNAYRRVQRWAPNLKQASLDDLKYDPTVRDLFAEYVALHIGWTEAGFPSTITLNRIPDDIKIRMRDCMHRLQELLPLQGTGRGTAQGFNEFRTSAGSEYGGSGFTGFSPNGPLYWTINPPPGAIHHAGLKRPTYDPGPRAISGTQPSKRGRLGALPTYYNGSGGGRSMNPRNDFTMDEARAHPYTDTGRAPSDNEPAESYVTHPNGARQAQRSPALQNEIDRLKAAVQNTDRVRANLERILGELEQRVQNLGNEALQRAQEDSAREILRDAQRTQQETSRVRARLRQEANDLQNRLARERAQQATSPAEAQRLYRAQQEERAQAIEDLINEQDTLVTQLRQQQILTADDEVRLRNIIEQLQQRIETLRTAVSAVQRREGDATFLSWQQQFADAEHLARTAELLSGAERAKNYTRRADQRERARQ